jgi:ectoine hydroxylase-related dioxygenase (phytanoyl-CoA dioxygenase family)
VPGSHRWRVITRDKIAQYLDINDATWPAQSEELLSPLVAREIAKSRHPAYGDNTSTNPVVTYLPKRGDVLIWHGRLMHRGSRPNVPGSPRRAVIAHFSGITHRPDMPMPVQDIHTRGWYFPITTLGQDSVMKSSALKFSS